MRSRTTNNQPRKTRNQKPITITNLAYKIVRLGWGLWNDAKQRHSASTAESTATRTTGGAESQRSRLRSGMARETLVHLYRRGVRTVAKARRQAEASLVRSEKAKGNKTL